MTTLHRYLWKEWREHGPVVLGLLAAVPVLLAIAAFALPHKAFHTPLLPTISGLACLGIAVFAICSDLVPAERMRFVRRLPSGLLPSFLAKLCFFLVAALALAAYGYFAGGLTNLLKGGTFARAIEFNLRPERPEGALVLGTLWVFAVSCWIPRGILAVPATALMFGLLILPAVLLADGEWSLSPRELLGGAMPALWAAGAVLAAALAFLLGRRFGGRPLGAVKYGLMVPLLCTLPFWASTTKRFLMCKGYLGGEPRIVSAIMGEGGRYLFVNRYREWHEPRHYASMPGLILDLDEGRIQEAGPGFFRSVVWGPAGPVPHSAVRFNDGFYEGRSAKHLDALPDPLAARARFAVTRHRTGDGREAWFEGSELVCEAPSGEREILWEERHGRAADLGIVGHTQAFDLSRLKAYARRDLGFGFHLLRIRRGRWLLTHPKAGWQLFDPETNERSAAPFLARGDRIEAVLDDGRVLLRRRDGPLVHLDPESGEESLVSEEWFRLMDAGRWLRSPARTPAGRRVFYRTGDGARCVALFDETAGELLPATGTLPHLPVTLVACPDEETAIVAVNDERILRVRFGSDWAELLYRVGE
jgi:hypothetical protein